MIRRFNVGLLILIFSFVFIGEIQNTFALNSILDPELKKEEKIVVEEEETFLNKIRKLLDNKEEGLEEDGNKLDQEKLRKIDKDEKLEEKGTVSEEETFSEEDSNKTEKEELKREEKETVLEEDTNNIKDEKLPIEDKKDKVKDRGIVEEKEAETIDHKDKDEEEIEYKVIFKSLWNKKTHPNKFPDDASFSTFVGIVHNKKACLWKEGTMASKGLAKLAETGKNGHLEKEISKKKKKGGIDDKFFIKGGKSLGKERSTEIEVCEEYPMVSMAAMIGPSPDWFTGIDSVCLIEQGRWVDKKIVMIYAYDAGTQEGKSYEDKGKKTQPQDKIMRIEKEPFLYDGELIPVGCIMFVRDDD
ncbi:spondin domain-containing protein [Oceanirhabdus sp. W0125-5]|uniref:spondin domain-containing protein n=1 Tax=Oceanirhabdus sp. W0125-5 TaxID=2999116 RepID=UPI0022F2EE53|nr:spondin domain-containing protein [Oceanirhabdus sp. W0125-5]WBW97353.1 spondin domain-containing protein [Oceanirhabdus sp. W0125-5]